VARLSGTFEEFDKTTSDGCGIEFCQAFSALSSGRKPFLWQTRLYEQFCQGNIPTSCCLPTGLGKTSIIPIWLLALAQSSADSPRIPRRMVYVVNRRTVVDQASDDAKRFLGCILRSGQMDGLPWSTTEEIARLGLEAEPVPEKNHAETLCNLRHALAAVCGSNSIAPLAVSTLRGELADNGDWKCNPARASIIIGTIDMIGSKLLFSGYGDGRYSRPLHAGLLGQDTLIVHDEAHLSPAFDVLLQTIEAEQKRTNEAHPIRVTRLSATTRRTSSAAGTTDQDFSIQVTDLKDPLVWIRVNAKKSMTLRPVPKKDLVGQLVATAIKLGTPRSARVLVYVQSPEVAAKVAKDIRQKLGNGSERRVGLLTGEIRGFERDELARGDLFKSFRSDSSRPELPKSVFLVATSAGEVGADLDADHLACDLSTLDSMAQRFGRVNRMGGDDRAANITVFMEEQPEEEKALSPFESARVATKRILKQIVKASGNVSPSALSAKMDSLSAEERGAAFSPVPAILQATDILFDSWSLTSIDGKVPGRPEVGPYLHGNPEKWEPPETRIAWRADIELLARCSVADDGSVRPVRAEVLEEVFETFPLRSIEQLRGRSDRVLEELQFLATRHPDQWVVLISRGEVRWEQLAVLAPKGFNKNEIASSPLAYATIVLPTVIGGLRDGCLDGKCEAPANHLSLDVAEIAIGGKSDRQRVFARDVNGDGKAILGTDLVDAVTRTSVSLSTDTAADDGVTRIIEYRVAKGREREPGSRVGLDEHNKSVGRLGGEFAAAAGLAIELVEAVSLAAASHDVGKGREIWQRYANNWPHRTTPGGSIAKSEKYGHWGMLNGYRHEFGSLVDASLVSCGSRVLEQINCHPERHLILHLIAAHHGWSRPHFERKHFDPSPRPTVDSERVAAEAIQRFADLQQRFGRWGLASMESLVRCADIEASKSAAIGAPNS